MFLGFIVIYRISDVYELNHGRVLFVFIQSRCFYLKELILAFTNCFEDFGGAGSHFDQILDAESFYLVRFG